MHCIFFTAVSGLRGKKGRSLAGAANVSQQRAIQGHEEARETKKGNQQETMQQDQIIKKIIT